MANARSVSVDFCNDTFDLANFPSLPFPVENDDLNLMARMGSLFDAGFKEGSVHNAQTFSQAPQCAQTAAQTFAQSQQLSQPATMSVASTQGFGSLSEPMLLQQDQPQPLLAEQPVMPSFPKGYVQTGMTMQQMQTPFALNSNTSFDSESSQQKVVKTEQPDSYLSDDQSDPDDTCAATPRPSSRKRNTTEVSRNAEQQEWLQQKKKVGRPITYNGDPNAPELTEAERRRVKRRIANRESARRVQQRRKEMIDELQHKRLYVQHHHHHLMQHLSKMELEKGQLIGQLTDMKARCVKSQQDNTALKAQVAIPEHKFGQQNQLQMGQQWPNWGTQQGPSTPQQALHIDVQEPHM